MSENILNVFILSADHAPAKYSLPIMKSTGVARKKEISAEYGIIFLSNGNHGIKSYTINATIGSERSHPARNL